MLDAIQNNLNTKAMQFTRYNTLELKQSLFNLNWKYFFLQSNRFSLCSRMNKWIASLAFFNLNVFKRDLAVCLFG